MHVLRRTSLAGKNPLHHGATCGGVKRARKDPVTLKLDAAHRHLSQAHLRKHPVPRPDAVRLQKVFAGLVAAVASVLGCLPRTHHYVTVRQLVSLGTDHGFLAPRYWRKEGEQQDQTCRKDKAGFHAKNVGTYWTPTKHRKKNTQERNLLQRAPKNTVQPKTLIIKGRYANPNEDFLDLLRQPLRLSKALLEPVGDVIANRQ